MSKLGITNVTDLISIDSINPAYDFLLNDSLTVIFHWIIYAVLCQAIDLFGIATNIINIICFVKMGFTDPVNVSLLGLAVSDLGCLLTLLLTNICFTPSFSASDLPFDAIEFTYLTSSMPHICLTHVTGWITALITLERCLSITVPFKVKHMVTTRRVVAALVLVFVILTISSAPVYFVNRLTMKFAPARNRTVLALSFSDNRESVEMVTFAINNVFVPFGSFLVVIVCTIILVWKLNESGKWRSMSTKSAQAETVLIRNQKVGKMIVMISTLFIICFIPVGVIFIAMSHMPEMSFYGKYRNLLTVTGGFAFMMESINSSVNIFIYNRMSSKYTAALRHLFGLKMERVKSLDAI